MSKYFKNLIKRKDEDGPVISEEEQEMRAFEQFNQALAAQRSPDAYAPGYGHYKQPQRRAPGFDYVNWKPYGVIRYESGPNNYALQANALAPYVRSVLESGCVGEEEQRWKSMTQPVDTNSRPLHTGSRVGSRDMLGSNFVRDYSRQPSREMI